MRKANKSAQSVGRTVAIFGDDKLEDICHLLKLSHFGAVGCNFGIIRQVIGFAIEKQNEVSIGFDVPALAQVRKLRSPVGAPLDLSIQLRAEQNDGVELGVPAA